MNVKSSVTVSLVPEARGGPFVFWDDLPAACERAKALGFDAIEIFPPATRTLDPVEVGGLLRDHGLALAAVGTGAGWLTRKWHLGSPDGSTRAEARTFIRSIIDFGGSLGAPAIIGSMQGPRGQTKADEARNWLAEALNDLGDHALQCNVPLLYEPLNRYETELCNTIESGVVFLNSLDTKNVRLLADLFHMNIEEVDIAESLRLGGGRIGHVHFVDSNRRPAGCGHLDFGPIARALDAIEYAGYASAEAFPYPDPEAAARATMKAFREAFETRAP